MRSIPAASEIYRITMHELVLTVRCSAVLLAYREARNLMENLFQCLLTRIWKLYEGPARDLLQRIFGIQIVSTRGAFNFFIYIGILLAKQNYKNTRSIHPSQSRFLSEPTPKKPLHRLDFEVTRNIVDLTSIPPIFHKRFESLRIFNGKRLEKASFAVARAQ